MVEFFGDIFMLMNGFIQGYGIKIYFTNWLSLYEMHFKFILVGIVTIPFILMTLAGVAKDLGYNK